MRKFVGKFGKWAMYQQGQFVFLVADGEMLSFNGLINAFDYIKKEKTNAQIKE